MKEILLDLRGLNCPLPVLRAQKAMGALKAGEVLVLECTDPLTSIDVPNFAREGGHELLGREEAGGVLVFRLRRGGA